VKNSIFQPTCRSGSFRLSQMLAALGLLLCLTTAFGSQAFAQDSAKPHRKLIVAHDPEYPAVLKNGHFEGQVRIDATVLPNGSVSKAEIKGGNPILAQYARQAVIRWKYAPGPAQTMEEVVFNFNPNNR
jgi:TonB family protein